VGQPDSRWDDSVYGNYVRHTTDMLDSYDDVALAKSKEVGESFFPTMRVNESKHMSTINYQYGSADTSASDEAITPVVFACVNISRPLGWRP
jgi:hypothetical protein